MFLPFLAVFPKEIQKLKPKEYQRGIELYLEPDVNELMEYPGLTQEEFERYR